MNPSTPKVSVVITTYNDAKFIPDALKHLHNQTFQDFEIIIVNDGSTDEAALSILDELTSKGYNVLHKENGHLSSARNAGVHVAKAPYVLFHDADDYFKPTFLEKAVHILDKQKDTVAVTCYVQCFDEYKGRWRPEGGSLDNFLLENECCGCCLVRKDRYEACGGSDEQMKKGFEDWELWIRMLKEGGNIHTIKEYLFFYRIRAVSMTRSVSNNRREEIFRYMMEKHMDLYLRYLPKFFAEYNLNKLSAIQLRTLFKWGLRRIF